MTDEDEAFNDMEKQSMWRKRAVQAAISTTQSQRTWVGLTDEQIKTIEAMALTKNMAIAMTMATLKENNT